MPILPCVINFKLSNLLYTELILRFPMTKIWDFNDWASNYRCKDSVLEVPVLGGIFSKHLFKMWISNISNVFIAYLHINGLELYSKPNQVLLKCSSFSIIFSFVGSAFCLSLPKSLFSRKIRRKLSLHCLRRTSEMEYLAPS